MLRRQVTFGAAVGMAIRQSDLPILQKLRLRLAIALRPEVRAAVEEYCLEKVNSEPEAGFAIASVETAIDLDNLERLLQLLIQYLPEIIKIIGMIIGMFAVDTETPAAA